MFITQLESTLQLYNVKQDMTMTWNRQNSIQLQVYLCKKWVLVVYVRVGVGKVCVDVGVSGWWGRIGFSFLFRPLSYT